MYKVFIVDDEAAVVKSLSTSIDWEAYQFEVTGTFTDSLEAMKNLSPSNIDLLITDVCMPGLDGLTLMKQAKALIPGLKVIVVSAHDNFKYVKIALQNGAENYLLKPIDQQELIETLQKTVENIESNSLNTLYAESSMMAFKSNILERWVRNTISESELMERAELIGINLQAAAFTTVIIQNSVSPESIHEASMLLKFIENQSHPELDIHFFINSTFQVVGILFEPDTPRSCTLQAYHDIIAYEARKTKINLFTVIGPTVNDPGDIHNSYTQAMKYTSILHLGFPYVNCSDFPEETTEMVVFQESLVRLFDPFYDILPGEMTGITQAVLSEVMNASNSEDKKKIALSSAVNIYHIIQENQTAQIPPRVFMEAFCRYPFLQGNEISQWLEHLLSLTKEILHENQGLLHPYVRKSIEYIYSEANQNISLKSIAAEFNVSPAYLGQLFRTQTGKYFNDYLTSVRLERSKKLIADTDMKVGDIATQVGFSSQTYFNRIFKRTYGTSPREYRYKMKTHE